MKCNICFVGLIKMVANEVQDGLIEAIKWWTIDIYQWWAVAFASTKIYVVCITIAPSPRQMHFQHLRYMLFNA